MDKIKVLVQRPDKACEHIGMDKALDTPILHPNHEEHFGQSRTLLSAHLHH